jgi:hypothetical protein
MQLKNTDLYLKFLKMDKVAAKLFEYSKDGKITDLRILLENYPKEIRKTFAEKLFEGKS